MNQASVRRHRVNRVINYMHDNFDRQVDLLELATVACLSKFHFSRTFTRNCLQSPLSYLWQLRLERAARRLVLEPCQPITEIALASGFSSLQTFSQSFKTYLHSNPQEFRNAVGTSRVKPQDRELHFRPPAGTVTIETRPALRLAYVRNFFRDIDDSPSSSFGLLSDWARRNAIEPDDVPLIGVCPDNPRYTTAKFFVFDAALPVPSFIAEDDVVSIRTIPAGTYAVVRIEAPYRQHLAIWEWLVSEWLRETRENYVQKWSYELYQPTPERSYSDVNPTELCLRLEDREITAHTPRP